MRKFNLGMGVGLVFGLIAACGGVMPGGVALAQPGTGNGGGGGRGGFGGMGGQNTPALNSRQFERYLDTLAVTKEQRDAARTLFDGYQDQVKASEEAMRVKGQEMREKMREDRDPATFEDMRKQMTKAREERSKLDVSLFDDVKAILTTEQAKNWDKVDRAYRRDTTLRRGRLSGEGVDVARLLDNVELTGDAQAAVKGILDEYDTDLDRELTARNKVYDEMQAKMQEMFQNRDPEAAQEMVEKGRAAGVKVRDLNQKYAKRIEEALPDDKRAAFSLAAKKASFPDVYRATRAERELAAAVNLADLDTTQKASLTALKESYGRDIIAVNDKMAQATEENEMKFNIGQMFGRGRGQGGPGGGNDGDENNPMADLRKQRRDMDRAAQDKLDSILTKAQKDKLPQVEEEEAAEGGRRRMRGQGGERRQRDEMIRN